MAHYAKIGLNNRVISVAPVDNNIIINADGREDDDLAISHLISTTGWPFWVKCSYNTKAGKHWTADKEESDTQEKALRKNYPGIGWTYDEDRDAFIPPKPSASFVLNEEKCIWNPPVDYPSTGHREIDGKNIPYVKSNASFSKVLSVIASKRLGCTLVKVKNSRKLFIITDGDTARAAANCKSLSFLKAKNFMTKNPKYIDEKTLVPDALSFMNNHRITVLLVKSNGKFKGLVSLYSILDFLNK